MSFTDALTGLVKTFLVPGSPSFLLVGLTAGAILAYGPRRSRRLAVPALTLLAAGYWLGSLPIVSEALATRFHARSAQPATAADLADVQAIVVLGAGVSSYRAADRSVTVPDKQTVYNALEGGRLFRLLSGRVMVIASGGIADANSQQEPESVVLRDLLVGAGVPEDRIIPESGSRTTREQALNVAPLLKAHDWAHIVLVTPAVQMPRAAGVFAAQGIHVIPGVSPFQSDFVGGRSASLWRPNGGALSTSQRALYDYMAWSYYWMRGWLA